MVTAMMNIELEKAQSLISQYIKPILASEEVPLLECSGRILSDTLYAPISQPPFDRSPLDGYAIKAEDTKGASIETPVELQVIYEVCAGNYYEGDLHKGQAIRIMTGAPMPKGANTVSRQEDTNEGNETVLVYKQLKPYMNYCYKGEDVQQGDILIEKNTVLTSAHIGLLASMGYTRINVKLQPKIGLVSTGDELIEPGQSLTQGKIYNSNLYTIATALKELNCQPIIIGSTGDDVELTSRLIKENIDKVDVFITTGGVSVGKKDILHDVIKKIEAKRLFWRVKLKPGTPILSSIYKDKLLLSLSGNPSAALITYHLFFPNILSKLTEYQGYENNICEGVLQNDFNKKSITRRFVRAYYEEGKVYIGAKHSSGVLSSMIGCNCLIDIEAECEGYSEGDTVKIVRLY
jgi:molybdopterin molybdotransferase